MACIFVLHRLQLIGLCLRLFIIFAEIYRDLPAFNEIFVDIRKHGGCKAVDSYPGAVKVRKSFAAVLLFIN
jgi:hypothetical protein